MPPLRNPDLDSAFECDTGRPANGAKNRRRRRSPLQRADDERQRRGLPGAPASGGRRRRDGRESFKCGRCRTFVGPTVSGGRHRNHRPLCLTSRHVDLRRPGDRVSPCRALMAPVGTLFRAKGEQAVLHRCNGCGLERRNRVAAADDPLALLRLPPVAPRVEVRPAVADAATADGWRVERLRGHRTDWDATEAGRRPATRGRSGS